MSARDALDRRRLCRMRMERLKPGMGTGKEKKKPEVKILGDHLLKKIQYFPPKKI